MPEMSIRSPRSKKDTICVMTYLWSNIVGTAHNVSEDLAWVVED